MALRVFGPRPKMSIVGRGGNSVVLSRIGRCVNDGLSLREVPEGLSGFPVEHEHDEVVGSAGAVWRGIRQAPQQITLQLQARGDVKAHIDELLGVLGQQGEPSRLVVATTEDGYRWLEVRYVSISEVQWFGLPGENEFAQFSVQLWAARPLWQRFEQVKVFSGSGVRSGKLEVPLEGNASAWPKFKVSGVYRSLKLRPSESVEWQELPQQKQGWVVVSDPAHRSVASPDGAVEYTGVVPWWPDPLQHNSVTGLDGTVPVFIDVQEPGDDFRLEVIFETPEATRAW